MSASFLQKSSGNPDVGKPVVQTVKVQMGGVYIGVLLANLTTSVIAAVFWYLATH